MHGKAKSSMDFQSGTEVHVVLYFVCTLQALLPDTIAVAWSSGVILAVKKRDWTTLFDISLLLDIHSLYLSLVSVPHLSHIQGCEIQLSSQLMRLCHDFAVHFCSAIRVKD